MAVSGDENCETAKPLVKSARTANDNPREVSFAVQYNRIEGDFGQSEKRCPTGCPVFTGSSRIAASARQSLMNDTGSV